MTSETVVEIFLKDKVMLSIKATEQTHFCSPPDVLTPYVTAVHSLMLTN